MAFHIAKRWWFLLAALTIVFLAIDAPAGANDVAADGWKVIEFPGIAPSRFIQAPDVEIKVLSDHCSAMLYRGLCLEEIGRRDLT